MNIILIPDVDVPEMNDVVDFEKGFLRKFDSGIDPNFFSVIRYVVATWPGAFSPMRQSLLLNMVLEENFNFNFATFMCALSSKIIKSPEKEFRGI